MAQDAKGIAPKHMPVGLELAPESRLVAESVLFMASPCVSQNLTINSHHIDHLHCKSLKVFPNFVLRKLASLSCSGHCRNVLTCFTLEYSTPLEIFYIGLYAVIKY